jgi:hypothetical protein
MVGRSFAPAIGVPNVSGLSGDYQRIKQLSDCEEEQIVEL